MFSREQKIVLAIGAALIVVGIAFLALQIAGLESIGSWVPLISGIIVLAIAILTRLPGFSILGCLLTGGGAGLLWYLYRGDVAGPGVAEPVFLLFVSGGLFCIPLLTRFLDSKTLLWPILPGAAGLITGILLLV